MKLNKQEVIASIKGYSMMHDEIKSLVASVTSAEDVENAIAMFQKQEEAALKRKSRWATTATGSAVAFFASVIFMLAVAVAATNKMVLWTIFEKSGTWGVPLVLPIACAVLFLVSKSRVETLGNQADQFFYQSEVLQSIEGSDACKEALEYVRAGHPSVLAWRDMVIAERETLRYVDVSIMGSLHRKAERELAEAQAQARNAQACRMVHGVDPVKATPYASA